MFDVDFDPDPELDKKEHFENWIYLRVQLQFHAQAIIRYSSWDYDDKSSLLTWSQPIHEFSKSNPWKIRKFYIKSQPKGLTENKPPIIKRQ